MVAPCFTTAMAGVPLAAVAMDTVGRSTSPKVSILKMASSPMDSKELTSPTAMAVMDRVAASVVTPRPLLPVPALTPSVSPQSRVTASRSTQLRTDRFTTPPRASLPVSAMWRKEAPTSRPSSMSCWPV